MKAVIFAAGQGERMMPLTKTIPKCMLKVQKKPILEWNLLALEKAGIKDVIIIVRHARDKIINTYGTKFGKLKITYEKQSQFPGTAMALYTARKHLKRPFIAMNGDLIFPSKLIIKIMKQKKTEGYIALQKYNDPTKVGVALIEDKKIYEIVEKPVMQNRVEVWGNVGLYKFKPSIFPKMPSLKPSIHGEFELTTLLNNMALKGSLSPIFWTGKVLHFTTPKDLVVKFKIRI